MEPSDQTPQYRYSDGSELPPVEPSPPPKRINWGAWGAIGALLLFLFTKLKVLAGIGKFLLVSLKFLKLGKILTTGGSMLISMWAYAMFWGWPFGVGIVLLIFIHEMGHVFVAWRQGLPISAPVFVPFMGAVIFQKEASKTAWSSAIMGIGGPAGGTIGALACWGIFQMTGSTFFLGLAYVGFFLNLFNLIPIVPLDGGWIAGAISPWLWLIGAVGLVTLYFTDVIHNPFILIIVLLGIPHMWHGLRHRGAPIGGTPATLEQRLTMGVCYLGLCIFLGWAMAATYVERPTRSRISTGSEVARQRADFVRAPGARPLGDVFQTLV